MFLAGLDKHIKSNDPLNQTDAYGTNIAYKKLQFLDIKIKLKLAHWQLLVIQIH